MLPEAQELLEHGADAEGCRQVRAQVDLGGLRSATGGHTDHGAGTAGEAEGVAVHEHPHLLLRVFIISQGHR